VARQERREVLHADAALDGGEQQVSAHRSQGGREPQQRETPTASLRNQEAEEQRHCHGHAQPAPEPPDGLLGTEARAKTAAAQQAAAKLGEAVRGRGDDDHEDEPGLPGQGRGEEMAEGQDEEERGQDSGAPSMGSRRYPVDLDRSGDHDREQERAGGGAAKIGRSPERVDDADVDGVLQPVSRPGPGLDAAKAMPQMYEQGADQEQPGDAGQQPVSRHGAAPETLALERQP
jgi:hypothetical protein